MDPGIQELLRVLPPSFRPFEGSEYPMSVSQAILGGAPDVGDLRRWLSELGGAEVKDLTEPAAIAAEVIESAAADRAFAPSSSGDLPPPAETGFAQAGAASALTRRRKRFGDGCAGEGRARWEVTHDAI